MCRLFAVPFSISSAHISVQCHVPGPSPSVGKVVGGDWAIV